MKRFLSAVVLLASVSAGAVPVASGKLVLADGLTEKAKGIRTVFISIYDASSPAPMPCAAQKFALTEDAKGEFLAYTIDTDSLTLMGCPEVPATMRLKAKLDKDGSAGRDAAGDIVGVADKVKKGSKGTNIKLDKAS